MPRWLTGGLVFPLIVLNGWVALLVFHHFKSLITVLLSATLLSFILDYPVRWLHRRRVSRLRAVLLVFFLALSFFVILGLTLVPIVIGQLNELATRLPSWIESGSQQLQSLQSWAATHQLPINLSRLTIQLEDRLSSQLQSLSGEVLSFVLNAVGSVVGLLLTVVLTFYLLLHGKRLWDGLFQLFPASIAPRIRQSLRQNFENYFIAQATIAASMGVSAIIAFLIMQVPFGLLFGLGIGVMTLFPFGASLSIWAISFLLALNSIWLGVKVFVVAMVLDQFVENGVAPRLLGGFTGLNPVWILISLLLGAQVAGILGLVVAVPFASSVKSLFDILKVRPPQATSEP